jgi:hypothetical protein
MQTHTLKPIGLCAMSAALSLGSFLCAMKKNDPVFALLGFATLLPLSGCAQELYKLARADQL